ncbi:MAG: hypothetical protein K5867_11305 [Bacteroidales bacterium]|nr:hypothetical protein [Bacteroidales bacterium]
MKSDRRYKIITVVVVVLAIALPVASKLWHKKMEGAPGDVFMRYKDSTAIDVSYVGGFKLNDTLRIAVTLLEAKDDAAWETLTNDFDMPTSLAAAEDEENECSTVFRLAPRNNPYGNITEPHDDDCVVAISKSMRSICVFDTRNEGQVEAVLARKVKDME